MQTSGTCAIGALDQLSLKLTLAMWISPVDESRNRRLRRYQMLVNSGSIQVAAVIRSKATWIAGVADVESEGVESRLECRRRGRCPRRR